MGGFNPFYDKELAADQFYMGMGDTAENLAKDLDISRDDQEAFACKSHEKALAAQASGAFAKEIVAITLPDGSQFEKDDCPRQPNMEKIKSLKPAFQKDGTVTAATSSPVTVGCAAAIIMSSELAEKLEMPLRAEILTTAVAGCDPVRMGMGPLPATDKALARAGLDIKDMDIIELNEAFAAQSLYVIRKGQWDESKINVLGGAIALGHPLGRSGVRIIGTAITALEQNGGKHALATMCVGGGQGAATILKRGS
jgi:acetyl-CoA acyltransferase